MTDPAMYQKLGELSIRMSEVEKDVAAMAIKLDRIHDVITGQGGGWRVLALLGVVAASLGGLIVAVLAWLWPHP